MQSAMHTLSLETILTSTRDSMQQLLLMLKKESDLLRKNHIDELESVSREKLTLTDQIEKNEKQRIHFLTELKLDANEPKQWLNNSSLNLIWQDIKKASEACQKQNQINGLVINNNRHKIQAQLDILNATPASELVYSATGASVRTKDSHSLAHV